ncbi:hypothetical protein V6N13_064098 [Hibiscus sabdariffa]|uniref:Uncharacterized protein n=1 Tax=Hibiscus sabdariffa TaxID=183260 RepID=A0ABR2R224_9ROSI
MMDLVFCRSFSKIDSRYSNCRAVGVLLLSPQYDFSIVEKSLKVTSSIGDHYHSALFEKNLNVIMVLLGVWNVSFLGYLYFQIIDKFMSIIQHVNRESTYEGMPIHGVSFSYEIVPCDFIVAMKSQQLVYPNGKEISNSDGSKSNFFTQPNVPAYGKTTEQLLKKNIAKYFIPYKTISRNQLYLSLLPSFNAYGWDTSWQAMNISHVAPCMAGMDCAKPERLPSVFNRGDSCNDLRRCILAGLHAPSKDGVHSHRLQQPWSVVSVVNVVSVKA